MAVMGTFSSFTGARLAIYASQASLNVTGNNIANINTKGYTRQRMDLVSLHSTGWPEYRNSYQVDIGYGVLCDQVSQLRDPFLDIRYRNENSELGFYETKQDALSQLASILDEVAKGDDYFGVIEKQLGEVFETLENLKQRPGSHVYDDQFRAACYTLTGLLNDSAKRLETVRDNKAEELKQDTNKVNLLLKEIRAYNDEIRTQGICGDNALELRDARNVAIDELSKYVKIDVKYSNEYIDQYTTVEKLSISLAGTQPEIKLIDGIYGTQFMMNE
ncbi:MAG: flagellar hook-associated protein FlgK, partial [Oscillospiraceae bacterium]|nr:flagellar hook-associated protein FlgK [Oscillospiraceae bacterium]